MFKKIFLLLAAVLLILGGVAVFRILDRQYNVVVTFANAKHLMVDDHVYLSGALAGKVKAIEPEDRQVAITIALKKNFFNQLSSTSTFFIDNDALDNNKKCLLIRLDRQPGNPITTGARLPGIDSAFKWGALNAGDRMAEITNSEPVEKSAEELTQVWQDIRQAFEGIDLEKMEEELRKKTEALHRNFNKALESEGFKKTMTEIEEKLAELKQALKEAGDSETAQKLKQSLEDLFKRLEKEAPERSDVKI